MGVSQTRPVIQVEGLKKRYGKTHPGPTHLKNVSREEHLEREPSEERRAEHGFLINRNFTWLAIGQAISNVGDLV